jgi:hypothetical protein
MSIDSSNLRKALISGSTGSGKSAFAVYLMLEDESRGVSILSNVLQCKVGDKLKIKEFLDFVAKAHALYTEYIDDDNKDDILISLAKKYGYYGSTLYIDEAHNIFKHPKKELIWFTEYHRHFFVGYVLITQYHKKINYEILPLLDEECYRALPSGKRSNNALTYKKYDSPDFDKDGYLDTIRIPKPDYLFDLYKSGAKIKSKSIYTKYIFYFIALVIMMFGAFYLLVNMLTPDTPPPTIKPAIKKESIVSSPRSIKNLDKNSTTYFNTSLNYEFIIIDCYSNRKDCNLRESKDTIDVDYLTFLFKKELFTLVKTNYGISGKKVYKVLVEADLLYKLGVRKKEQFSRAHKGSVLPKSNFFK